MAVATPAIVQLARSFVCVRVTDLRPLDLARWRFDFDLTFAALTATPDGAVLHRYGGRDAADAEAFLSLASFEAFLRGSAARFADPAARPPAPSADLAPRTIEASAAFRRRDAEKQIDCVHCHTVNDFEFRDAAASGRFRREQLFVFPDPARLGFEVERDQQQRVARVAASGPAARAGLAAGDRLLAVAGQPLLTRADLQWALHQLPTGATKLELCVERAGAPVALQLELAAGWKECDALEYAWRPYKWNLTPGPGFGGKPLDAARKRALGLATDAFAQEVGYLVTWGDKAATGKSAQAAGLKKGDVVVAVAGKSDFANEDHFQAWFRLERKPGETVELVVLRDGQRRTLKMKVVE
ncbi:MAG: PDZ domain-containing protein [Planctomycetes bacterium]|nr:PDZ domain-containing protein [Planctomycetota bacterium]